MVLIYIPVPYLLISYTTHPTSMCEWSALVFFPGPIVLSATVVPFIPVSALGKVGPVAFGPIAIHRYSPIPDTLPKNLLKVLIPAYIVIIDFLNRLSLS